ncbi:Pectinesterase, catalytic [Corchorus olitorius]|uniref:Pectinesterase n=1 Tax=Corchorus olitorius TaxID=93759 RepID=A0A1R3K0I9_9ROSI|nr:Pectinesterase, catalytic [Corchorus olitorius]
MANSQIMVAIFIIIAISIFLPSAVFGYKTNDVKLWCNKTPHPQPCEYYLGRDQNTITIKDEPHFLKISMHLALQRATHEHSNTLLFGSKCRNEREKAAWSDCLALYEQTIDCLNKTLDSSSNKISKADVQTWLSTALTNLETCKTGLIELGVSDHLLPMIMSNKVTKLISNALALNKARNYEEPSYNDGFPTWLKDGDRKLLQKSSSPRPNIVVGPGGVWTINEAIAAASKHTGRGRYVIHVKAGTYNEIVEIKLNNIMLVGDGIGKTIITGSRSVKGGQSSTSHTPTVAAVGYGFIARGITFKNTAGAHMGQAVALLSSSEHSVFYRCSFEGHQDTLYTQNGTQFYRECDIYGTVDFICGNAAVVLQLCNIYVRRPNDKQHCIITANKREKLSDHSGIIIHNSRVTADRDWGNAQSSGSTYLGRPWGKYSRTVFMNTNLDSVINPKGWLEWNAGKSNLGTLYYAEYSNTGPGSSTSARVTWKGYHRTLTAAEASKFTVANFLAGNSWLPATHVPFTPGLK